MKWFGIGTAVMALMIWSSAPTAGQERPQADHPAPKADHSAQRQGDHADAQGFINDLTIANLAEVQLGKTASEKGSNPDVKAFGQMMVKDHTQANNELKQIASQLSVHPPSQVDQKHKDLATKLSKLSGAEFDREYINAMVMGHEEVLGKLRARADAGAAHGDQALTQWAAKMVPAVEKHLERAREVQKKVSTE